MFLEPGRQTFRAQAFDRRAHLGRDQLVLGLRAELGVRHLDRQDAGQAFAGVLAGRRDLLLLGQARALDIAAHDAGQAGAEGRQVSAPIPLRDVVGEAQHRLVVAVVPPQGQVQLDAVLLAANDDDVLQDRGLRLIEVAHEGFDAALIVQHDLDRLRPAMIRQLDDHARVQEGQLAQAVLQRLQVEIDVAEGRDGGEEGDFGAGQQTPLVLAHRRLADDRQRAHGLAALEADAVLLAVAIDDQLQLARQRVHHRRADTVQTARHLVRILVELPAGVQLGHDDLGGGNAFLGVDGGRDAPPVVGHGDRAVLVQGDRHQVGVAGQSLVDGVVHHLIDHVVQARAVVRVADIHAGALAHRVQAFENLDGIGAVLRRGSSLFGHENVGSGSVDGQGRGGPAAARLRGANQRVPKSSIYRKFDGKSEPLSPRRTGRRLPPPRTARVPPAPRTAGARCPS